MTISKVFEDEKCKEPNIFNPNTRLQQAEPLLQFSSSRAEVVHEFEVIRDLAFIPALDSFYALEVV
jgi:hypothetical protein